MNRKLIAEKAWVYFSNTMTVVGTVSLVENLKSWHQLLNAVYGRLETLWEPILNLLQSVGDVLFLVIQWYRSVFHPVFDFLFGWLNIAIPQITFDLLVFLIFTVILFRRFAGRRRRNEYKLRRKYSKVCGAILRKNEFGCYVCSLGDVELMLWDWLQSPRNNRYEKRNPTVNKDEFVKLTKLLGPQLNELGKLVTEVGERFTSTRNYMYMIFGSILLWIILDWYFFQK